MKDNSETITEFEPVSLILQGSLDHFLSLLAIKIGHMNDRKLPYCAKLTLP